MNALHSYKDVATTSTVKSTRDSESEVIWSVTRRMKRAAQNREANFAGFTATVSDNRRLWTLLSTDVASRGNALPAPIKANILYLGEFVQIHSGAVLRGEADVAPLIDINLAVLRGLGGQEGKA